MIEIEKKTHFEEKSKTIKFCNIFIKLPLILKVKKRTKSVYLDTQLEIQRIQQTNKTCQQGRRQRGNLENNHTTVKTTVKYEKARHITNHRNR